MQGKLTGTVRATFPRPLGGRAKRLAEPHPRSRSLTAHRDGSREWQCGSCHLFRSSTDVVLGGQILFPNKPMEATVRRILSCPRSARAPASAQILRALTAADARACRQPISVCRHPTVSIIHKRGVENDDPALRVAGLPQISNNPPCFGVLRQSKAATQLFW
jgi:hypothetical protein